MLDALEVQLGTKTSTAGGGAEVDMGMEVGAGGASWPSSWDSPSTPVSMGVASLLLEGLAAGVAFHNDVRCFDSAALPNTVSKDGYV